MNALFSCPERARNAHSEREPASLSGTQQTRSERAIGAPMGALEVRGRHRRLALLGLGLELEVDLLQPAGGGREEAALPVAAHVVVVQALHQLAGPIHHL